MLSASLKNNLEHSTVTLISHSTWTSWSYMTRSSSPESTLITRLIVVSICSPQPFDMLVILWFHSPAFHLLQIHWAKLTGRIWEECFSVQMPTYSVVMAIEDEIRKFELSLPAAFRSHSIHGTMERPYLLFQVGSRCVQS